MQAHRHALPILVLLALAGCGRQPAREPLEPVAKQVDGDIDRSRDLPADVTVTVTGAIDFTWQDTQTLAITRVGQPGLSVNLLTIGFTEFHKVPGHPTKRFRWAFSLLNAYRDQPDTFTLTNDPVTDGKFKNLAFLMLLTTRDAATDRETLQNEDITAFQQFDIKGPCTLAIGELESTGTLDCPQLADKDGNSVNFTASWNAVAQP